MAKNRSKLSKSIGLAPGTAVYTGSKPHSKSSIEVYDYNLKENQKHKFSSHENCFSFLDKDSTTWININGLSDVTNIESIGSYCNLHPLIVEDITNIQQRPKIDEYADYLFVVLKMLYYNDREELVVEHVSMVLGKNYVLSFQESDGDVFDNLRQRIEQNKGIIRKNNADYLLYALMDAIVDHYFLIIEMLGEKIERIEDKIFNNPDDQLVQEIQLLKKEALRIRRSIFPLREVVSKLEKSTTPLFQKKTRHYLRDLYDHSIQVIETVEVSREMLWSLMDMYMTNISNKMNEVMKVLTIMATIFIPLTFIAGVYGMNFKHIPELDFRYGYPIFWSVIILVFVCLVFYFKRKKWL